MSFFTLSIIGQDITFTKKKKKQLFFVSLIAKLVKTRNSVRELRLQSKKKLEKNIEDNWNGLLA